MPNISIRHCCLHARFKLQTSLEDMHKHQGQADQLIALAEVGGDVQLLVALAEGGDAAHDVRRRELGRGADVAALRRVAAAARSGP